MFYNIYLLTFPHISIWFLISFIWFIVSYDDMKDWDLEVTKNVCMMLIANIDREFFPSTVTQFLHRHTSASARVLIFPNLSSEVHTRGAIILDSEKEFQKMCDFLNDPNCIITSSTGRYSACILLKYDVCRYKQSTFIVGSIVKSKRLCQSI